MANEQIEINLLLEAIYQKYGYDFRNYAGAHIKRRIRHFVESAGLESISALQHEIIYDLAIFEALLNDLSINVTEMFRDPSFFRAIRREVVPILKTYPHIKIWHAGCSTGEEVYSMVILLMEEGLYDRTQIYATDFSEAALKKAQDGIIPLTYLQKYTANYQKAGGQNSFADYFTAQYDAAILESSLRKHIVFANHNLSTDAVFGEMQMIICRNVLIYFNQNLQNKVMQLFHDSLRPGGLLCLGAKESLKSAPVKENFTTLAAKEKIFMKRYQATSRKEVIHEI